MAESIMSTLKRELTKRYTWKTRLDLEIALVSYVGWYNARRKHRSLTVTENGRLRRSRRCKCSTDTIRKLPCWPWLPSE